MAERLRRVWDGFFYHGFSGESLGILRILFGLGLFLFHFSQFDNVFRYELSGAHYYYLDPMWHFEWLGIDVHVPWVTWVAFALLLATTVTLTLGQWTRSSIVLLVLCLFYLKGARDGVAGDVHHRYLMPFQILLFLLLSRSGQVFSLDARRRRALGRPFAALHEWEASWPIKAMQLYIVSFYFWAGIAKLRVSGWEWFAGGERIQSLLLKRALIWGAAHDGEPLGNSLAWNLAHQPELCMALALMSVVMEIGFPLLLLVKNVRMRLLWLSGVAFFHVANLVLVYVGFVLIPVAFLVFFDLALLWRAMQRRWPRLAGTPQPT